MIATNPNEILFSRPNEYGMMIPRFVILILFILLCVAAYARGISSMIAVPLILFFLIPLYFSMGVLFKTVILRITSTGIEWKYALSGFHSIAFKDVAYFDRGNIGLFFGIRFFDKKGKKLNHIFQFFDDWEIITELIAEKIPYRGDRTFHKFS